MAAIELPARTRMLLLLLSPQNPLWKSVLDGDANQTAITKLTGLAPASPWSWKMGSDPLKETTDKIFDAISEKINKGALAEKAKAEAQAKLTAFKGEFGKDGGRPTVAAAELGIKPQQCRLIIDQIIYKKRPLLPTAYYTKADAARVYKAHEGIYRVLVKRGGVWLICALHVRYIIPGAGGHFIRCKLHIRATGKLSRERGFSVYDGALVTRANNNFWLFEAREEYSEIDDQFYFITRTNGGYRPMIIGDGEGNGASVQSDASYTYAGRYLTTEIGEGEGESHPIVADSIILQRIAARVGRPAREELFKEREAFMDGQGGRLPAVGIISDSKSPQCKQADAIWGELIKAR